MKHNLSFEQIEQYLEGKLENTERLNFERALKTNEQLLSDTTLVKDLNEAIEDAPFEKMLSAKLEVLGNKYVTPAVTVQQQDTGKYKKVLLIGLLIGLFAVLGAFWAWQTNKAKTSTQIYASYYTPYTTGEVTRGENMPQSVYQQGIDYYKAENYEAAIPIFQQASDKLPINILLGNCYLNTTPTRTKEAIVLFEAIVADQSHVFIETAEWYLGLALLKDGQKEAAKNIFNTLAEKGRGKYPKLAKEILKDL